MRALFVGGRLKKNRNRNGAINKAFAEREKTTKKKNPSAPSEHIPLSVEALAATPRCFKASPARGGGTKCRRGFFAIVCITVTYVPILVAI